MAYTFSVQAPNSIAGFVFTASGSGNTYTSDSFGYIKGVASNDINAAILAGCEIVNSGTDNNNLTATNDPTPLNDNTQDYGVGSTWINNTYGRVWTCTNAATSSAVWRLGSQPLADFRNIVDGGDFTTNPWQRGTSFSGIASSLTYTADRFFAVGGASSAITVAQSSISSLMGFQYGATFGRTSSNSSASPIWFGQVFESADSYRAQGMQVTLSFYAQAGATFSGASSKISILVNQGTGSNQGAASMMGSSWTNFSSIINTTQIITSSITRYQFTGTVSSNASEIGFQVGFTPSNTAGGAADNILFAGFQFEVGGCASEFEHRDIAYEIETAQRYFWRINEPSSGVVVAPGTNTTASSQLFFLANPVLMRVAPVVILSSGTFQTQQGSSLSSCTISSGTTHTQYALTLTGLTTGASSGGGTILVGGSSGAGFISASADF